MRFGSLAIILTALVVACTVAQPPRGRRRPGELNRIRVLVIADTESDLANSVKVDLVRIRSLFADHVPKSRYTLDVIAGKKVTRKNVLNHWRNLKTGRDEALICFFAGHGAIDRSKGHYMQMQPATGPVLLRSELRVAMYNKRPGLMVLLTDCCSNHVDLPPKTYKMETKKIQEPGEPPIHPTLRELFFLERGIVDITGAQPGSTSWGDDNAGGLFTRSVCGILLRPYREMDRNRDGKLAWKEAFRHLRERTSDEFRRWKKAIPARDRTSIKQDDQVPKANLIREEARVTRR